ncbi:GNAT family N-acetyltransferase [Rhodopseudomonas palustris]|uniref:GNAT family N-acetyltransferase n=1 Tax=Rhodopseudomonas palustris TaxID=1076 RepID=UPI00115D3CD6|nr:GNAT family N-acetyltransferase [Rhodopseudomonas palustris]QDL97157.1 GNAT family N-acetyltransferase [Rhodopseudomonas palustris]
MKLDEANRVILVRAQEAELKEFRLGLQDAFAAGFTAAFGTAPEGPIPSDAELGDFFHAPGAVTYHVVLGGMRVGGVVLTIEATTHRNSLDLFFVATEHHGKGIGSRAWRAIEAMYPDTLAWETHTPYFEKRNIHFYVNKCGFKIVEFYNVHHPDPHQETREGIPGGESFRFQKVYADQSSH